MSVFGIIQYLDRFSRTRRCLNANDINCKRLVQRYLFITLKDLRNFAEDFTGGHLDGWNQSGADGGFQSTGTNHNPDFVLQRRAEITLFLHLKKGFLPQVF